MVDRSSLSLELLRAAQPRCPEPACRRPFAAADAVSMRCTVCVSRSSSNAWTASARDALCNPFADPAAVAAATRLGDAAARRRAALELLAIHAFRSDQARELGRLPRTLVLKIAKLAALRESVAAWHHLPCGKVLSRLTVEDRGGSVCPCCGSDLGTGLRRVLLDLSAPRAPALRISNGQYSAYQSVFICDEQD